MQADLNVILPEILLSVYAMAALLGAVHTGRDRLAPLLVWVTAGLMALLAIWIGMSGSGARTAFGGCTSEEPQCGFRSDQGSHHHRSGVHGVENLECGIAWGPFTTSIQT